MEAQLQHTRNSQSLLLSAKLDLSDEETQNENSAMQQELQNEFKEDYEPFFRHSFLISFYSLIERNLERVCVEISEQRGLKIKTEDLHGGIDKTKEALNRYAGVRLQTQKNWQALTNLQLIRNCLVHADGQIARMKKLGDRKQLWALIKQRKGLRLDTRNAAIAEFTSNKQPYEARLIAESVYCQHSLKAIAGFFDSLFAKLGWS
jgi:hypothetical protein